MSVVSRFLAGTQKSSCGQRKDTCHVRETPRIIASSSNEMFASHKDPLLDWNRYVSGAVMDDILLPAMNISTQYKKVDPSREPFANFYTTPFGKLIHLHTLGVKKQRHTTYHGPCSKSNVTINGQELINNTVVVAFNDSPLSRSYAF